MRGPQSTINGGTTNAVENKHGPGINGVSNGDAVTYDPEMDLNANATELLEGFYDDVIANLKLACREANGVDGPASDDVNDNRLELATAINTAANVLHGSSSFVASGLRFTTSGASLDVDLAAGVYVYAGQKYHATEPMLSNFTVQVDGSDAGTGSSFTLLPSRDHYISIAPTTSLTSYDGLSTYSSPQRRVSIQVRDAAVGADPSTVTVPIAHFVFAMIRTDGSGVTEVFYSAPQKLATEFYGWELSNAMVGIQEALIPTLAGSNIGTLIAPDEYGDPEVSGGRFVGTVFAHRSHWRTHNAPGRRLDRATDGETSTTDTSGAASSSLIVFNMGNLPNGSLVELQAEIIGLSDVGQGFTTTIRRMCMRTSGGGTTIYGATRVVSVGDPDTIGCSADFTQSGDNIRVTVTGAGGHDIHWLINVRSLQSQG